MCFKSCHHHFKWGELRYLKCLPRSSKNQLFNKVQMVSIALDVLDWWSSAEKKFFCFLLSWENLPTLILIFGGKNTCDGWTIRSLAWWISLGGSIKIRMERLQDRNLSTEFFLQVSFKINMLLNLEQTFMKSYCLDSVTYAFYCIRRSQISFLNLLIIIITILLENISRF